MTSLLRAQSLLLVLWLAAGCRPADVVAQVGDRRVTQADVRAFSRLQHAANADDALDAIVQRELLASAAVGRGLHETPEVKARLRAAEREILSQALLDAEVPAPEDKALQAAYDGSNVLALRQLELAHVFISSPPDATREAQVLAQSRASSAWARLLGGEAFEEVARAVSEDTATRDKGGTLGVVREGQIAQEVFEAAAALQPGAASKPVQTPFGFHILKAVSAVTTVKPPFAEVRSRLEKELREAKLKELNARLGATVAVKRYEEPLAELRKERR